MRALTFALLLLPALSGADDFPQFHMPKGAGSGGAQSFFCPTESESRFCSSEQSCRRFCSCACRFDVDAWGSSPHPTTCPGARRSGPGFIPEDSPDLRPIPDLSPYIVGGQDQRATQPVIDGLRRLARFIAADPNHKRYGYTVKVMSCYRPAVGDPKVGDGDVEAECGLILSGLHMLAKPLSPLERAKWRDNLDPRKKGLAWPGATPHSAGTACDLVLLDRDGQPSFDWRAGVDDTRRPVPHSSIDQKLASKLLDEAVTNPEVGGKRLDYEAWHYEWGGPSSCRCVAPDCADKFWPPTGQSNCG